MTEQGSPRNLARFLHRIGRLKHLRRTGWLDRGVPASEAESVADHSFRVALLAWLAAPEGGLDRNRVLKMALLHDLAEAVTGDEPPYDPRELERVAEGGRSAFLDRRHVRNEDRRQRKQAAESAAFADLIAGLPEPIAAELTEHWNELELGVSAESRFVKQADKLETFLQSREYLMDDPARPMTSFALEVSDVIDAAGLVELRNEIADLDVGQDHG